MPRKRHFLKEEDMSLYEAAKDAVKIAQKADNIELVQKVLDVQKGALDMQEKMHEKNEEIEKLKSKIKSLKETLEHKEDYYLDKSVYWKSDDKEQLQPYCPSCFAKEIVIPMQKAWPRSSAKNSIWVCADKQCNTHSNPWDATLN